MTDRPPTQLPTPSTGRPGPKSEPRRPYHLGVAMGLCAGLYAGSLTAVTVLQIGQDRALIQDRAPVGQAIDLLGRHNDAMASEIEAAGAAFQEAAADYDGVASGVSDLDAAVSRLATRVAAIKGSAMRLPDALALPPVLRVGGGSSSGGGTSGKVSVPKPKPAPPPANASTGASGG